METSVFQVKGKYFTTRGSNPISTAFGLAFRNENFNVSFTKLEGPALVPPSKSVNSSCIRSVTVEDFARILP